jgi:hypothetical protein
MVDTQKKILRHVPFRTTLVQFVLALSGAQNIGAI